MRSGRLSVRAISNAVLATERSSGWMSSNTDVPISGAVSSPRIRSVAGLA